MWLANEASVYKARRSLIEANHCKIQDKVSEAKGDFDYAVEFLTSSREYERTLFEVARELRTTYIEQWGAGSSFCSKVRLPSRKGEVHRLVLSAPSLEVAAPTGYTLGLSANGSVCTATAIKNEYKKLAEAAASIISRKEATAVYATVYGCNHSLQEVLHMDKIQNKFKQTIYFDLKNEGAFGLRCSTPPRISASKYIAVEDAKTAERLVATSARTVAYMAETMGLYEDCTTDSAKNTVLVSIAQANTAIRYLQKAQRVLVQKLSEYLTSGLEFDAFVPSDHITSVEKLNTELSLCCGIFPVLAVHPVDVIWGEYLRLAKAGEAFVEAPKASPSITLGREMPTDFWLDVDW